MDDELVPVRFHNGMLLKERQQWLGVALQVVRLRLGRSKV